MYKMIYDYHTHTTYSHGKGSIEDNVKVAIEKGLKAVAIADHGPGHLLYGVKQEDIGVMKEEIQRLNQKYPQIEIKMAMETNICFLDNCLDMDQEGLDQLDIVLAGYHYGIKNGYCIKNYLYDKGFLFKGEQLRLANTEMVVNAVNNNRIDILTHPGEKGPFNMREIAAACAKNQVAMEINNSHAHLTVEEIVIALEEGAEFVIGSDAHVPSKVGSFEKGLERALEAGVPIERIRNIILEA